MKFVLGRVENIMGKGENAGYQCFPMFSKGLFVRVVNLCGTELINSLPNNKILNVTKLKAFADGKINVAQIMISVFDGVENIVGKGENAG